MVEHSKPCPDIYLMACKSLGVEPARALAIEDSPNGIRAAHSAGMIPVMVPDLIAPDQEMREKSVLICRDLLEVMRFLDR
jgi:beta-phosphoglucomutase-like phosphatase (HAD superfamily)